MRRYVVAMLSVALCCAVISNAKTRTEQTRVVKPDTMAVATPDSTRLVWDDTLKITTVLQDTALVVKRDTVRTHSVSRIVPKTVKK
jgi:hypothetical protein